jgi:hypothetical protein
MVAAATPNQIQRVRADQQSGLTLCSTATVQDRRISGKGRRQLRRVAKSFLSHPVSTVFTSVTDQKEFDLGKLVAV